MVADKKQSSRGSIHISNLNQGAIRIVSGDEERKEDHPPQANLHEPLIHDFVNAVIDNREPSVNGETGKMVAMITEKIYGR